MYLLPFGIYIATLCELFYVQRQSEADLMGRIIIHWNVFPRIFGFHRFLNSIMKQLKSQNV